MYSSNVAIFDTLRLEGEILAWAISLTGRTAVYLDASQTALNELVADLLIVEATLIPYLGENNLDIFKSKSKSRRIVLLKNNEIELDQSKINLCFDAVVYRSESLEELIVTLNKLDAGEKSIATTSRKISQDLDISTVCDLNIFSNFE